MILKYLLPYYTGKFCLNLPADSKILCVSKDGYGQRCLYVNGTLEPTPVNRFLFQLAYTGTNPDPGFKYVGTFRRQDKYKYFSTVWHLFAEPIKDEQK